MSLYKRWLANKGLLEDMGDGFDPSAPAKFGLGDDLGVDHDQAQTELMKLLMSKYADDTVRFVSGIAQRDQEVATLLKQISGGSGGVRVPKAKHPHEEDEVVPASADTGYNPSGE